MKLHVSYAILALSAPTTTLGFASMNQASFVKKSSTTTTTTALSSTTTPSSTTTSTSTSSTTDTPPASTSVFLTPSLAKECISKAGGSPLYAYSLKQLETAANDCLAFPNAYGLTVRYAMKACPSKAILQYFNKKSIHIDASSGYEVRRAIASGIPPEHISLSSQELPYDFEEFMDMGVKVNACSLSQLERIGKAYSGKNQVVGIRMNPGVGSGGFSSSTTSFSKTNVGGPSSSFGIWFAFLPRIKEIVSEYGLVVERVHTHIGSGSDPGIWQQVATKSLSFCKEFVDTVTALNLGGGYKVGRVEGEQSTDLQKVGAPVVEAFRNYATEHGKELQLEIEPGTYLLAMAGALVSTVQDKVETTGEDGHVFLKLDAGMTDVLRPSLYGAVHPMTVLPGSGEDDDVGTDTENVVVVGHCCESGDLMTPAAGEPEQLAERSLRKAEVGDVLVMDGSGAYCAGMSSKNYNSFPEAPEVLVDDLTNEQDAVVHLIRARQSLEQICQNELDISPELLN